MYPTKFIPKSINISPMEIEEFKHMLVNYMQDSARANHESTKAFLFLEFIRSIFKEINDDDGVKANFPHALYPDQEKSIKSDRVLLIRGRVDALLGNLIIEFENNLTGRKQGEATEQLKRYTAILWNNKGVVDYLCVATDGLIFFIYRPRSTNIENFTSDNIILEEIDKFDIRQEQPDILYKRLDRYILYKPLSRPTSEDIVNDFGSKSIILKDCISTLRFAVDKVKDEISTIYSEWAKYLSIVYGNNVENRDLFLKHTYLATLAKLMVYSYYQNNTLPTSKETINRIITGGVFKEYGIENFLIEDFYSWIVKGKVNNEGVTVVRRILDGLARYDVTGLNEDVFRELYQQLVDPAERHDLGEYYTPDWLAERIVRTVVKNGTTRLLDPSCGSGTFLACSIRHKLSYFPNGMKPSDQLKTIINTVYGIDVHPLAVLISKANYLMAFGNLLGKKEGSITISVYMADSIIFPVPIKSIATFGSKESEEVYIYEVEKNANLILPQSLVDAESADSVIDSIREFAINKVKVPEAPTKGFQSYLEKRYGVTADQFGIIVNTTNTLIDLIKSGKDTIHSFILKNIYKPHKEQQ